MEEIIEELKKCLLVCSNCHRGIHSKDIVVPDNWQMFFDASKADELLLQVEKNKSSTKFFCPDCGKEMYRYSSSCVVCSGLKHRKVNRPTRSELKNAIRNLPIKRIAQQYGVTDNAIRGWCKEYGLPARKIDINQMTDEQWLSV